MMNKITRLNIQMTARVMWNLIR